MGEGEKLPRCQRLSRRLWLGLLLDWSSAKENAVMHAIVV